VLNDIISNDFAVKKEVKVSDLLCNNKFTYIRFLAGSVTGKKGGSMEPLNSPGSVPVLFFNHNHHNSVSKKS